MERTGARRHWLIWAATVPIGVWAVLRGLGLESGFPLVALMAYTPYVAIGALLVAAVAVALRNWAAATVGALALACLLVGVAPRAIGSGEDPRPGDLALDVLSVNIHHGTADAGAVVDLVDRRGADVLSVQELTPSFARELEDAGLAARLPHAVRSMHRGASGGGLYSRFPLRRLAGPAPVDFRMPRARVALPGGRSVRVVAVHPYPPGLNSTDRWSAGLHTLPDAEPGRSPWILPGDFNATLDHAELREILEGGYRDAAEVTGKGLTPTWPAAGRRLPPVTIDHVLADRRIGIVSYAVEDVPGSDHRAVYARLAVPAVLPRDTAG